MKKIISILFGASLLFAASAQAAGIVGFKVGQGEIGGESNAYTAGSTSYGAESGNKSNEYAAIFAELNVEAAGGLSLGVEYIPFEARISLDKGHADVENATSLYALYARGAGQGSVYVKAGYFMADIGTVANSNGHGKTVNSQDDTLEGPMIGIGIQSAETVKGIIVRAEATYTDLDSVAITTTSNGSTSVKKTADGDITTFSVSFAKAF